jgi:uncharacterized protein YecE (DUF72 family)
MGWGYEEWVGPFYPPGTPANEFLPRYARVFSLAEVDSSFYRAPSAFLTRRWAEATPPGFRFTPKVPQEITHKRLLRDIEEPLAEFWTGLEPLARAGKLGPLVAQFPASFSRAKGGDLLGPFLEAIPTTYRVAVELRHRSWFVPETYETLRGRNAALVWSVIPRASAPPVRTADFVYARFVGDRALTQFDHIQRDLRSEMEAMRDRFRKEGYTAGEIYALVNNHYMGFAPETAAILSEILDLPRPDLGRAARDTAQRSLAEFPAMPSADRP